MEEPRPLRTLDEILNILPQGKTVSLSGLYNVVKTDSKNLYIWTQTGQYCGKIENGYVEADPYLRAQAPEEEKGPSKLTDLEIIDGLLSREFGL
ncbi:MAG: hypothetical protein WC846_04705 [Candidatus Gracilibacteria bacterium]